MLAGSEVAVIDSQAGDSRQEPSGQTCQIDLMLFEGLSTSLQRSRHRPAPDRSRTRTQQTRFATAQQMPLNVEGAIDSCMRLEEILC